MVMGKQSIKGQIQKERTRNKHREEHKVDLRGFWG